ncbi:regulator of microtubule dynamics protein 1-like isoform X1 [Daktulosphaira vitifoliae]|uniref:regulator of microtubule dynamics protein 1-like isoform X1 n=1 Tax=Daktulosphaira vitifoliae TaxID=58002 RepID=UPI0021AAC458|nr:regulator of microtubule dynamics protein 1-like isoform X1 [Daktulosphaira vitifoliae]XP_050533268.1 regulator of microtubule dynamics protein 1-like isoform X1 [Daktulosphaira vitifoliae]
MSTDSRWIRGVIAVAVSIGITVGSVGVVFLVRLLEKKEKLLLKQEVDDLNIAIIDLQTEIKDLKKKVLKPGHRLTLSSSSVTSETSLYTALGTDDEFHDMSSDNEDSPSSQQLNENSIENMTAIQSNYNCMSLLSDDIFDKVDELFDGNDEDKLKAYEILVKLNEERTDDIEVLWRLSKSCQFVSKYYNAAKKNPEKSKTVIDEGVQWAKHALEMYPGNCNAHKWFAICSGARGQLGSTKEKIEGGYVFQNHINEAIRINPKDPTLYFLKGKLEYEVAILTSFERRIASWLYGEVPKGTVPEAIELFLKFERESPIQLKDCRLHLAKCFIAKKEYEMALQWLEQVLQLPTKDSEDKEIDGEANQLLKKYSKYKKS